MSAAIHTFPRSSATPADDDLLAELARAVRDDERARRVQPAGATVDDRPARSPRSAGGNDLVVTATPSPLVRRRRAAVVVATLALALMLAVFAGLVGATADGDVATDGVVTLQSGQTLWGVAEDITPAGGDVRATVDLVMQANDFESASLPAGTPVRLPVVDQP